MLKHFQVVLFKRFRTRSMDFVCPIRSVKIIYRSIIRERYVRETVCALCVCSFACAVIRSIVRAHIMQGAVGRRLLILNAKKQPAREGVMCACVSMFSCECVWRKGGKAVLVLLAIRFWGPRSDAHSKNNACRTFWCSPPQNRQDAGSERFSEKCLWLSWFLVSMRISSVVFEREMLKYQWIEFTSVAKCENSSII